jgi:putative toxin-antitoxin system antitoxin component (TIGR02293 family)
MNAQLIAEVLGDKRAKKLSSSYDMYEFASMGLTRKSVDNLMKFLGISMAEIAELLPISERTLRRYELGHKLDHAVSSQVLDLAVLMARGLDVFGERTRFISWLDEVSLPLGRKKPIELLDNRFGIRMVLNELGRIEHGVFG